MKIITLQVVENTLEIEKSLIFLKLNVLEKNNKIFLPIFNYFNSKKLLC